jgi:hypothetical protein
MTFVRSAAYRRRRSISPHKLLSAVVIVLAISATVGAVLRGDPGPSLGMADDTLAAWYDSQSQAAPASPHVP